MQTGIEKNVFGNHPAAELCGPPPTFASDPLKRASLGGREDVQTEKNLGEIVQDDVPLLDKSLSGNHEANYMKSASPGLPDATTRKGAMNVERQNSEISHYMDDEDTNRMKYTKRGMVHKSCWVC